VAIRGRLEVTEARWRGKRRGWGHWMARVASARISEDDGMACMSLWERAAVLMEGVGSACARIAREARGGGIGTVVSKSECMSRVVT